jgi:hypothetical protein
MQDLQKDINLCISPLNFFPEKKRLLRHPVAARFLDLILFNFGHNIQ